MEPEYRPDPRDLLPASMRFLPAHVERTVTMPNIGELRDGKGRPYPANRAARRKAARLGLGR